MTTYRDLKVGDTVRVCAAVDEFCGSQYQGIYMRENNVTKAPATCSVTPGTSSCKNITNVAVLFRTVRMGTCYSCEPLQIYREIGSAPTNSSGIAAREFTVTDQDRIDYVNAINAGYLYKILTCIADESLVVGVRGKCSDSMTVSSGVSTEPDGRYEIHLSYWEVPFHHYSAQNIIDGIAKLWNNNASKLTGWSLISTTVNTNAREVVILAEKKGSILIAALIAVLIAWIIAGILFFNAYVTYQVNKLVVANYEKGYEDAKTDVKKAVGCDGTNPFNLTQEQLTQLCKTVSELKPDPEKAITINNFLDIISGEIEKIVKRPTIRAPFIALMDSEIEISGKCDPNVRVRIYRDDRFSIWDIFKGDPLKFLNDQLAETTSDAEGHYKVNYTFDKQEGVRIYAQTGKLQSKRTKVYVLETVTALMIIAVIVMLAYIAMRRMKRRK